MIVNVREGKARLSELIAKAAAGEEVVITVRGRPKARLVGTFDRSSSPSMRDWADELRERMAGERGDSSREILEDLRGDRW